MVVRLDMVEEMVSIDESDETNEVGSSDGRSSVVVRGGGELWTLVSSMLDDGGGGGIQREEGVSSESLFVCC